MAIAGVAIDRPVWARPALVTAGASIAAAAVLAVVRLPVRDSEVWVESLTVAVSAVALVAVTWWLTGRAARQDQHVVLTWGLGSGLVLGGLWIAEIAFNNLTPHTVSTAGARGVLDNLTWAVVGMGTVGAAGGVAARTGRWRSGLRAGVWSGVGNGLGAALGGALLLAFFRSFVEEDPLMRGEWRLRDRGVDLSLYVTRETMAGVGGHLWVLGVVQGALLGLLASSVIVAVIRYRLVVRQPRPAHDSR
jgi:hypothetical protein